MVGVNTAFSKFPIDSLKSDILLPKKVGFGFGLRIQFYIFWYKNFWDPKVKKDLKISDFFKIS